MQLFFMRRLEVLLEAALAEAAEDGEIVHLVAGQRAAGVVAVVEANGGAVDDVIGVTGLAVFALQHLHAGAVIGTETEIVGFVVAGLIRQAICVVLVARESRPAALTDGVKLADQQSSDLAGLFLTEDMFDLAVGLGVV